MYKFAIVGFGCAGYHAARAIREGCPQAVIDIYERAPRGGANPMLTTYYAGGKIGFEQMFPFGKMEDICRELGLTLIKDEVAAVEAEKRAVVTRDGAEHGYDKILVSTGASALMPEQIAVEEGAKPFLMRTVQEAEGLKEYLASHEVKSAAVIGASMVGIKVAEITYKRGIKTALLGRRGIFSQAAYPSTAKRITETLEGMGVRVQMGVRIAAISPRGVVFADGSVLEADMVCMCMGTRANTELVANTRVVEAQPITVRRGIVIDTHMRTSCPGIYAAGDCCEGTNIQTGETAIIGLWASAAAQGQCAGENMIGLDTEYYGGIPHNITHFFGMTFVGLGDPAIPGEHRVFQSGNMTVEAVTNEKGLMSINIFGDCEISGVLKSALMKQLGTGQRGVAPIQRALMENAGMPKDFIEFIGGEKQ